MKMFAVVLSILLVSASACFAQYSTQQPTDTRVEPIYPHSPYSFSSTPSNYDPYQFNWEAGRWDYVPIPYAPESYGGQYNPYRFNQYTGRWDYVPLVPAPPGAVGQAPALPPIQVPYGSAGQTTAINAEAPAGAQVGAPVDGTPQLMNDSPLWSPPATQPVRQAAKPRHITFQGHIISERAVNLNGEVQPHILLRLCNPNGACGTVDVGTQFQMPATKSATMPMLTAEGFLGDVDGTPVLFARTIQVGSTTIAIDRHPATRPAK